MAKNALWWPELSGTLAGGAPRERGPNGRASLCYRSSRDLGGPLELQSLHHLEGEHHRRNGEEHEHHEEHSPRCRHLAAEAGGALSPVLGVSHTMP